MVYHSDHAHIIISYRETDQTLVTTMSDYLANYRTKYRNWRLYGKADTIELPVICALLINPKATT